MTHTYKVETPSGTITRRTARTYTHVVVPAVDQRTLVDARLAEDTQRIETYRAEAQARVDSGVEGILATLPAWVTEHYYRFDHQQYPVLADYLRNQAQATYDRSVSAIVEYNRYLSPAGTAKRRANLLKAASKSYIGWAGRYDLAVKVAASHPGSLIIEVK